MGGRRVLAHGVVFFNDPRPRATIHGRPQAEIDSVSIRAACRCPHIWRFVYTCRSQDERAARPENIAYMTMFFEGRSDVWAAARYSASRPRTLFARLCRCRAAGVRARRYERDSALRGVVPADNGA